MSKHPCQFFTRMFFCCFAAKENDVMKRTLFTLVLTGFLGLLMASSCVKENPYVDEPEEPQLVSVSDVAKLLTVCTPGLDHMAEVHDAVQASVDNGYDSEYTMANIFNAPGAGVGREYLNESTKASSPLKQYSKPLRELFREYYGSLSKASANIGAGEQGNISAEAYLDYLENSAYQIYWPNHELWDGKSLPVITFDPMNGAEENIGWAINEDGSITTMAVDEKLSLERPVWVISNNNDATGITLDVLQKNDPSWGGSGEITVLPSARRKDSFNFDDEPPGKESGRSLIMTSLTLRQNFDSWFQGANEVWVKLGRVEAFKNFEGDKDANVMYYNTAITDFMLVVRQNEINIPRKLNVLLMADWTEEIQNSVFMLLEDDGGTVTSWNCSAVVKYNSRSYGFDINIPYRSRDDVIWRGQLGRRYIEATEGIESSFGEADISFGVILN